MAQLILWLLSERLRDFTEIPGCRLKGAATIGCSCIYEQRACIGNIESRSSRWSEDGNTAGILIPYTLKMLKTKT
jgi:hypothetical protein